MKKILIAIVLISIGLGVYAQTEAAKNSNAPEPQYRRSSLYLLMIEDNSKPLADTIKRSFMAQGTPEKFNDHNLKDKLIPVSSTLPRPDSAIIAYLNSKGVAKDMVAKWFKRDPKTGTFGMDLIAERGFYNASDLDVKKAKASKRGMAVIGDAGEELIKNTFVVVCDFKYINKEEMADNVSAGLLLAGGLATAITGDKTYQNIGTAAAVGAQVAGKGYVVKTTVYLSQLVWDDSTAAVFYNDLWNDPSAPDAARKSAFEQSNLFKLKYVGSGTAYADVQSSIFSGKSNEELIAMATKEATEKALLKLEKQYETFRTKTPLYAVSPPVAKIGLKEGLRGQDRYFVFEKVLTEDGKTKYKKVGSIRVKGSYIFDNRYVATGEPTDVSKLTRFYQPSGRKLMPGMLIQQRPDPGFCKPFNIFFGQFGRIFH